MIRVAKDREGEVRVDIRAGLGGRGSYVCEDPSCIELARKRGSLSRSLKATVPGNVYEDLERITDGGD